MTGPKLYLLREVYHGTPGSLHVSRGVAVVVAATPEEAIEKAREVARRFGKERVPGGYATGDDWLAFLYKPEVEEVEGGVWLEESD
jgi:hypothetical protein